MKRAFITFMVAVTALFTVSCGETEKLTDINYKAIAGEWHMSSWSKGAGASEIDIYVQFNEDHTFTLYQKLQSVRYTKYTGKFSIADNIISGVYDDNTAWATTYSIEFNAEKTQFTMTSQTNIDDISTFTKEAVPSYVVEGVMSLTSRGEEVFNIDRFF